MACRLLPVRLGARRPDRRSLAGIQRAELDPGFVRGARHRAPERIDLAHQVSLADTADGWVAAHLAERLDALRQQQCPRAHAGRGERRLGAGVTTADDDDIAGRRGLGMLHRCSAKDRVLPGGHVFCLILGPPMAQASEPRPTNVARV